MVGASVLRATIAHKRLTPASRGFVYGTFAWVAPLSRLSDLSRGWLAGANRAALMSLWECDFGPGDGSPLEPWVHTLLRERGMTAADGDIVLVSAPRCLGHVFNPVCFYLAFDRTGDLRAFIAEVNNTFGERHAYVLFHADHRAIAPDDVLRTDKAFHVSPFLPREGAYQFRIACSGAAFSAHIHYFDGAGARALVTSIAGSLVPFTRGAVLAAFVRYPMVSARALALIHWQALKLWLRRIRLYRKPEQLEPRITGSRDEA